MALHETGMILGWAAALLVGLASTACVGEDTDSEAGAAGTTATASGGTGGGGNVAAGGTSDGSGGGSTTSSGGSVAAAGSGVDCSAPSVLTAGLVADFEDWDGTTAAKDYMVNFNADATGANNVTLGFYEYSEADVTDYTLSFVDGYNSTYALSAADVEATQWGGGIGVWTGCMDGSGVTGLSFMATGSTSSTSTTETAGVTIQGGNGIYYTAKLIWPETWSEVQLPFANFVASAEDGGGTLDPSAIAAISFGAYMDWQESPVGSGTWVPVPGGFTLTIDDLSFY